ncbi:MAG TPA: flagellar type III secretion system pore protein FliP [Burkholderiaceae bacterium]|jgi:flagellar biosynthetic protein FliP
MMTSLLRAGLLLMAITFGASAAIAQEAAPPLADSAESSRAQLKLVVQAVEAAASASTISRAASGPLSVRALPSIAELPSDDLNIESTPPVRTSSAPAQAKRTAPSVEAAALPGPQQWGTPIQMVLGLTVLAALPALLVCMTSFLRIAVVLSMLRHAIGLPETPPNIVLIGMALLLTSFTMAPVWTQVNEAAVQPYMKGKLDGVAAIEKGVQPLRGFMLRQTREADIALMTELSKSPRPETADDVPLPQLTAAFIVSELRAAFQIGFVIFLPFLLIDLLVSSILMALGMMMMPPVTIALPLKILMFVLVDGWGLLLRALVGSFH